LDIFFIPFVYLLIKPSSGASQKSNTNFLILLKESISIYLPVGKKENELLLLKYKAEVLFSVIRF